MVLSNRYIAHKQYKFQDSWKWTHYRTKTRKKPLKPAWGKQGKGRGAGGGGEGCINSKSKWFIGTELCRFYSHKEIKGAYGGWSGRKKKEGHVLCSDFCPSCASEITTGKKRQSVQVQRCSQVNRWAPSPHCVYEYLINITPKWPQC